MFTIRHFREEEFPMVEGWWKSAGEIAPLLGMLPPDSTFILEINKIPALSLTIYYTNTPELAYLENFAGNPELKGDARREGARLLTEHVCKVARSRGYKRLLCLADKAKLKERYAELGWTQTLDGVATFVRNI